MAAVSRDLTLAISSSGACAMNGGVEVCASVPVFFRILAEGRGFRRRDGLLQQSTPPTSPLLFLLLDPLVSRFMDDNNWDLYAVVRGCSAGAAPPVNDPYFSSFSLSDNDDVDGEMERLLGFPELMGTSSYLCELQQLCQPFYAMEPDEEPLQQQQLPPLLAPAASLLPAVAYSGQSQQQSSQSPRTVSQPSRSKRRYFSLSTPLPVSFLLSDSSYGETELVTCGDVASAGRISRRKWCAKCRPMASNPICGHGENMGRNPSKGPLIRGKAANAILFSSISTSEVSSKGCQARKQVERSSADPGMLLITYTAEHNHPIPTHRSSLAGSTRQKLPQLAAKGGDRDQLPSPGHPSSSSPLPSPIAAAGLSPKTPLTEDDRKGEEGEEEDEESPTMGNVDMLEEDSALFLGMEVLVQPSPTGATETPATATLSSGYFDEGSSFEDLFFRSQWLAITDAAI
ncbi:hypothetical protein B296_00047353 [Ensete ventricosum]|uniref:WRKY domain-containing protein n=1 Tax=Ensete ventricosum TaxID=4639 RepID=A0A426XWI8_ENSVE|nr:hypothetical protein B296_00047353 [Ensete ventricosum]